MSWRRRVRGGCCMMLSPLAHHKRLERVELESGLTAFRCPETGGHWIPAENYWRWRSKQPATVVAEDSAAAESVPVSEFDGAVKLCPESGTVMTRYRVGHGQSFRVERSHTGGIWLDGGEWEALCSGHLQNSIGGRCCSRLQSGDHESNELKEIMCSNCVNLY